MINSRSITLEGDKYEVVWQEHLNHNKEVIRTEFYALRFGMRWRDLTGDKLILSMMQRIEELQAEVEGLSNADN